MGKPLYDISNVTFDWKDINVANRWIRRMGKKYKHVYSLDTNTDQIVLYACDNSIEDLRRYLLEQQEHVKYLNTLRDMKNVHLVDDM